MLTIKPMFLAALATVWLLDGVAQGQSSSFSQTNSVNAAVSGGYVPVSSSMTVSGLSGVTSEVQVTLNITNGYNGTLYAYLTDPNGQISILLNDAGTGTNSALGYTAFGYNDAGFNIVLSDGANNVHDYQLGGAYNLNGANQLTGTWAPDGRNISPQSDPGAFDTASTAADLSVFDYLNPNGIWTLTVADVGSGGGSGTSTFVSWGLTVVTVPEPQTLALMAGGVGMLLALKRRRKS